MKKIIIAFFLGMFLASGLVYAMAPLLICYMSSTNVCSNVTTSNPLPAQSN